MKKKTKYKDCETYLRYSERILLLLGPYGICLNMEK